MYFHLAANLAVTIHFVAVLLVLSLLAGNQSGATLGETCDETSKVPRYCAERSPDVIVKSDRSLHSDNQIKRCELSDTWQQNSVMVGNRRLFIGQRRFNS